MLAADTGRILVVCCHRSSDFAGIRSEVLILVVIASVGDQEIGIGDSFGYAYDCMGKHMPCGHKYKIDFVSPRGQGKFGF